MRYITIMVLLLAALPASAEPGLSLPPEDVPLADTLEILVLDRKLLAIDARHGGQREEALRLNERVVWTGSQGTVGVVFTDQRVLAVAARSAAWQSAELGRDETVPELAVLGDRVALIVTSKRALGFNGGSGNLVESRLGIRENLIAQRAGENVAVVITDRRALGLSPTVGGFFEAKILAGEQVASVSAKANLATVTTNRRVLIFRASTGTWEERRRSLN